MQVRSRLGVAKLGRLGAVKLYWEQHVPSHSSAASAQRAEAWREQAALESSGDVVIVDEEDGPAQADTEDDGVDEAEMGDGALDAEAAAREALISIWDEDRLQVLQQVKCATEQALRSPGDGSMERMRYAL